MHSSPSFSPPPALLITFFLSSSFFFCIFFPNQVLAPIINDSLTLINACLIQKAPLTLTGRARERQQHMKLTRSGFPFLFFPFFFSFFCWKRENIDTLLLDWAFEWQEENQDFCHLSVYQASISISQPEGRTTKMDRSVDGRLKFSTLICN